MSTETKTTELVIPSKESLVAPIVAARAEIEKALEACKDLTIEGDVEGKLAGYRKVSEHRKGLKGLRTPIEKARKAAKAAFLELGRYIDSQADELEGLILPEEKRLKALEDGYLEECRIEKENKAKAEALRLEARLKEAGERGAAISDIDMKCAREGSDLAWAQHLQQIDALVERRALVADRKDQLEALGAQIPENLGDLTEGEFSALLEEEIELQRDRERQAEEALNQQEANRLAEEQARETRRRFDLLTALGQPVTLEACAALLPEEFEEALADAKRKKSEKDDQDRKDREDLNRLRAQQKADQEAEEARKEEARHLALRPDRERILAWAKECMANAPDSSDPDLIETMHIAVLNLRSLARQMEQGIALATQPEDIDVLLEI